VIVVNEDGTLKSIGNFPDQFGGSFLQLGGFRQQLSNTANPKIFQAGGSVKPVSSSRQAEQALCLQGLSSLA
jgi:hypothetical protein